MDMYTPYMEIVQELFPDAKIIIDRLHLIQASNRHLNKLRIGIVLKALIIKFRYLNVLVMVIENFKTLELGSYLQTNSI